MFRQAKRGYLALTRAPRAVYNNRKRVNRVYEPLPVLAVEIESGLGSETRDWIDAALAFSTHNYETKILETPTKLWDMKAELERLQALRPSAYLFIGKSPNKELVAALRILKIPYRAVVDFGAPAKIKKFPDDEAERMKWHQAIDRRPVLYAHLENTSKIESIIAAFRTARRNFPDLLLIVSGIDAHILPKSPGFSIGTEMGKLDAVKYLDILVLKPSDYRPVISSVATAQLITRGRNLRAIARQALERAAAIVFYDVRAKNLGSLVELSKSGTVFQITEKGALGAALSQVLGTEAAAKIAVQSVARISEVENPVLMALDDLTGLERAA